MTRRRTTTRTVNLEVDRDAEPHIEQVGLYETTSRPARELPHPAPGETIVVTDDPLPRVRQWLADVLKAVGAIRTEPAKYSDAVRANAEDCSIAATKVRTLLREVQEGAACNLGTVALALERGAELAEAWERLKVNACLEKPVKSYQSSSRTGRRNTAVNNSRLRDATENSALQNFRRWRDDPRRRFEMQRYSPTEQLQKYRKVVKPKKRLNDRLGRLLRAGKLT